MSSKLTIVLHLLAVAIITRTQQCLLNPRGDPLDTSNITTPGLLPDSTQTIVTSYKFHCCGTITRWYAVLQEVTNNAYQDIVFQVWRPSPTVETDGCYRLVGQNRFPDTIDGDRIILTANSITVQPGDVVGYFTSTINGAQDVEEDNQPGVGILLDNNFDSETVWYHSITSQDPLLLGPTSCTFQDGSIVFQVGRVTGRALTSFTNAAPVVSANLRTSDCPASLQLQPKPTQPSTSKTDSPPLLSSQPAPSTTAEEPKPDRPGSKVTYIIIAVVIVAVVVAVMIVLIVGLAIYKRKKRIARKEKQEADQVETKDNIAYDSTPNIHTLANECYATNAVMAFNPAYGSSKKFKTSVLSSSGAYDNDYCFDSSKKPRTHTSSSSGAYENDFEEQHHPTGTVADYPLYEIPTTTDKEDSNSTALTSEEYHYI